MQPYIFFYYSGVHYLISFSTKIRIQKIPKPLKQRRHCRRLLSAARKSKTVSHAPLDNALACILPKTSSSSSSLSSSSSASSDSRLHHHCHNYHRSTGRCTCTHSDFIIITFSYFSSSQSLSMTIIIMSKFAKILKYFCASLSPVKDASPSDALWYDTRILSLPSRPILL